MSPGRVRTVIIFFCNVRRQMPHQSKQASNKLYRSRRLASYIVFWYMYYDNNKTSLYIRWLLSTTLTFRRKMTFASPGFRWCVCMWSFFILITYSTSFSIVKVCDWRVGRKAKSKTNKQTNKQTKWKKKKKTAKNIRMTFHISTNIYISSRIHGYLLLLWRSVLSSWRQPSSSLQHHAARDCLLCYISIFTLTGYYYKLQW